MIIIIASLVFLTTFLLLNQFSEITLRKQRRVKMRLNQTLGQSPVNVKPKTNAKMRAKRLGSFTKAVPGLKQINNYKFLENQRILLEQAGVPLKIEEFLGLSILSGTLLLLITIALLKNVFPALLMAILGIFLPQLGVRIVRNKRFIIIEGQLLNAVVLLANSLRAGHSFMQALELVSRETPAPLGLEFNRVLRETRMGVRLEDALVTFSQRLNTQEVELLVAGILIQREVGGNLGEILDTIADTIDKRIKMRAKLRTLTAQGRLSGWVVSLLPFALVLFIYVPHPEYAQLMLTEPLGRVMLLAGLTMMIIGILAVKKVVNIDV